MGFAEFYPYEAFKEAGRCKWWRANEFERYNCKNTEPLTADEEAQKKIAQEKDTADKQLLDTHIKEVWDPAFRAFMVAKREAGKLTKITGISGRKIGFANEWNTFVDGGLEAFGPYEDRWLFHPFESAFLTRTIVFNNDDKKALEVSEASLLKMYEKLLEAVDGGNLPDYHGIKELYDSITGDRITCSFENWVPKLVKFDMKQGGYVPVEDVIELKAQAVDINLPTGELLISDWFRIDGFRQYTDSITTYDDDISSAIGAINTTKRLSLENIGHVQTTNTSCGVEKSPDGKLAIIERYSAESQQTGKRYKLKSTEVGDFSCDLWWVTMLDKQTLIEALALGGNANPEQAFNDYIKSKDCYADNIVQLKVKPGRWRIHFGAKQDKKSTVKGPKFGFDKKLDYWRIMEPLDD